MRPRCFLSPTADSEEYEVMTIIANTFYLYEDSNHILYLFWSLLFTREKRTLEHKSASQLLEEDLCMPFCLHSPKTYTYSGFPQILEHVDSKDAGWSSQVPDTAIRGKRTPSCSAKCSCLAHKAQRGSSPEQHGMPGCMCSNCQRPA